MLDESVMQIEAIRRPFTVDEYDRIREAQILDEPGRIELLDGEILEMSPIGPRHEACVDRATELLLPRLVSEAIVRVQGSIRMGAYSRPQPDLVLLQRRRDFYASTGAAVDNALLVIEVSDTSIHYDKGRKLRAYARHSVRELWIEDLTTDTLLVFREPDGGTFKTELVLKAGDSVSPLAFPELQLSVSSLLGLDFE